jgi:hypothetical protein
MNTPHNDAEPPDVDTEVEHALEPLKKAEHDLEQAHEAEHRAEDEIRKAGHEIEEAVAQRNTEIIVNSRPREVHGHVATFDQIVQLAFPGGAADQNTVYSMTYRHAASHPHAGELGSGGKVEVKNGTIFNVTRTVRS